MCRLYGFRSNEQTKVECTLVYAQNALLVQSRCDRSGLEHADGWGIGVFVDDRPVVERRAAPAGEDLHFSVTAERIFATTVVAHVRRATVGRPDVRNTHPFSHGCWLFAHNGTVTGFETVSPGMEAEIPPALLRHRVGTTDSELCLFWLLARMGAAGIAPDEPCRDLPALAELLGCAVRELAGWCAAVSDRPAKLNFLLTDGRVLVASRWNHSLYRVEREGIHDCEICGIPHVRHAGDIDYRAVVIASEPISHEEWLEVPDRSVLTVDEQIRTRLYAA